MGEMIDKAKGKIKQAAGAVTGNKDLKAEGEVDEAKGKAEGVGNAVKQAAKEAKDAVTKR